MTIFTTKNRKVVIFRIKMEKNTKCRKLIT